MDVGIDATQIEEVVIGVADVLHFLRRHWLVLKQFHGLCAILCQHVERHGRCMIAQSEEYPLVLWQFTGAGDSVSNDVGRHAPVVFDAQ